MVWHQYARIVLTSLKAMLRQPFLWIALALYLLGMICLIPAGFVAQHVLDPNSPINNISGTIWSGSADIQSKMLNPGHKIDWSFQTWKLFTGTLSVDLRMTGSQLKASASVQRTFGTIQIKNMTASLSAAAIKTPPNNNFTLSHIAGMFQLNLPDCTLDAATKKLRHATGSLAWNAGQFSIDLLGKTSKIKSDDWKATINDKEGDLFLQIQSQAGLLGTVNVQFPSGRAQFKIKQRLTNKLQIPWLKNTGEPDKNVFRFRKRLI